jgi:ribonuclease Z
MALKHPGASMDRRWLAIVGGMVAAVWTAAPAHAAPCLIVTLTGVQSGPPIHAGQAGAGTLVRYGDDADNCSAVRLQFDTGRGTNQRLSQLGVTAGQLNAIFLTHMHSDHTEGLADVLLLRWNYNSAGPKLDVVCSADTKSPLGHVLSCSNYAARIGEAFIASGEIAQRRAEDKSRLAGGPSDVANVATFTPSNDPQVVWSLGDVKVSAIRSTHIPGHASYRVDTPAGSVVVAGDAGNDTFAPPRPSSTSAQVERLAQGADVIVHSTMHPVMGPDRDSGMPAPVYHRQAGTADLGAMAKRAGARHLMLTHLAPALGAVRHGPYKVPDGPLTEDHYAKVARDAGFTGNIVVGRDLATLRLSAK